MSAPGLCPAQQRRDRPLPQIFSPSADTWLRVAFAGALVLLVGASAAGAGLVRNPFFTSEGWVHDQPVPFSHKHHVGDDGIDCRYCHTGAETRADAGLPPTHTCMTCHSQLWTDAGVLAPVRQSYATGQPLVWNRVAQLPDYAYFDHHVHVANGVACVECHGRVDRMPLTWRAKAFTMDFCVDCHRHPEKALRPPEMVTRMDWSGVDKAWLERYGKEAAAHKGLDPNRLANCETCHR